jgi:hypothetical protein
LAQKYLTLSLKFLAGQINWTIILEQKIWEVGQSFWDGGSMWLGVVLKVKDMCFKEIGPSNHNII